MAEQPGTHIDVRVPEDAAAADAGPGDGRRWVGILFECCHVYIRAYRPPDVKQYVVRCPRCGREARVEVAPHGTNARFLRATI